MLTFENIWKLCVLEACVGPGPLLGSGKSGEEAQEKKDQPHPYSRGLLSKLMCPSFRDEILIQGK